jgi:DNA transformation protein and related proteins
MRDSSFVTHVLDLLESVGPVRARAMMGGHMIFCEDLPIALIADETLYLKADETTRPEFERAGGAAFTYQRGERVTAMSFWTPPEDTLDDPESMRPWARLALEAAARSRRPKAARQHPPRR